MKLYGDFDFRADSAGMAGGPRPALVPPLQVGAKTPQLLYFPDYRPTNPYQHALYAQFPDSWRARPGSLEEAARLAATGEDVVFHLHWPEVLFADCYTADRFTQRAHAVFGWLRHLRRHGGRSVWTAHNAVPHECRNIERQMWFHRELAARVDAIHVHSAEALDSLDRLYGLARERVFIVPHGTVPQQPAERAAKVLARAALGLQPDSVVFAFLGQLRAYKGIERFVAAFQLVRHRRSDVELLISGKPVPANLEGRWARVGQTLVGAVVREGYMSDETLGACLSAADAMVLPYESVLSSGSAHMALEHGLPLIVPDLPALREFADADAALTFEGMDVSSLADAIERFADLSPVRRATLSHNALRLAETRAWPMVGREMAGQIARVVARKEPVADEPSATGLPSLQQLYERAYALARRTGFKTRGRDPWRVLLPARYMRGESLRIVAERALRGGWVDGCNGFRTESAVDVAERIDVAGALPDEPALRGNIERIDRHRVAGWAVSAVAAPAGEAERWEGAGSVWICENDLPVAELSTRIGRPDVAATGLALVSGIDDDIVRSASRSLSGRIDLRSGRTGKRFCGSFFKPDPPDCVSDEPPSLVAAPQVRAHVDCLADGVLRGWAEDSGQPGRTVFIDIEIDGVRHCDVNAATFRQDLATAGIGKGYHGFELVVPAALCQRPEVHVRLLENGRDTPLSDTIVAVSGTRGYRTTFSPDEYLRWAYLHGAVPVGMYAESHALRAWFDLNLRLLGRRRPGDEPCIDIIMPVHDRRDVVGVAVASVLAQSYDNWRLIIVDDASRDGTADTLGALLRTLDDPRITLVTLEAHGGVSRARNAGLERSQAGLIAYLDSDNCWHPDFLRVMSGVMLDKPDVAACYCGQEVWQKASGSSEAELRTVRASPFNRSYLERCNTIDLNAFVHRRALYETMGGFHTDLNRLVDWDLILRYTRDQPACFVPALLSRYHLDAASNRISCLASLEDAEALIDGKRLPLFKTAPGSPGAAATAPAPLDILLVSETRADVEYWLTLNLGWIDPERDRLWYVPASEGYTGRVRLRIPGGDGDEDRDATEIDDGDRDVLLTTSEWSGRADWRSVVASERDVDTATGRLLERQSTDTGAPQYVDLTPGKIADRICDWRGSAKRHAIACAALPGTFLWVNRRRAARLQAALETVTTIEEALRQFQVDDVVTPGKWVNLYLPDLVAFRIQGPGAIA